MIYALVAVERHPPPPLRFRARVISGAGRGKTMGIPTINLALPDVPTSLREGIYAARVRVGGDWLQAALHYGPRPVFDNSVACEAHLLDIVLAETPDDVEIEVIQFLRDVRNFPDAQALVSQIRDDIEQSRKILGNGAQ